MVYPLIFISLLRNKLSYFPIYLLSGSYWFIISIPSMADHIRWIQQNNRTICVKSSRPFLRAEYSHKVHSCMYSSMNVWMSPYNPTLHRKQVLLECLKAMHLSMASNFTSEASWKIADEFADQFFIRFYRYNERKSVGLLITEHMSRLVSKLVFYHSQLK